MKWRAFYLLALWLAGVGAFPAGAGELDSLLRTTIREFNVRPLPTKPFERTPKFELGQALFFDPVLSGNRDVACATCHLLSAGTTDGLPMSIGTHGQGLGPGRRLAAGYARQPRNAFDLWNRDNNAVASMFWDGRVEVIEPVKREFRSPLGERLPDGFENLMAVQAVFPLARRDEMLGLPGDRSSDQLAAPHAAQPNEIANAVGGMEGPAKIELVGSLVMDRLLGRGRDSAAEWQRAYRDLFARAYPVQGLDELSIVDAGNALAHFEEIAFATRDTPWDEYVRSDTGAIPEEAKEGALIFFGRGRCAVCHNGPLFSDFSFHGIGVPDYGPGMDGQGNDLGRYRVTGAEADKYKFRTPPLRNVTLTAPYFHNGSSPTLRDAIRQHIDPYRYADKYTETGGYEMNVDQINAISPVLASGLPLNNKEVGRLIAFLACLEDDGLGPDARARIIPSTVPSGLSVPELQSNDRQSQSADSFQCGC